MPRRTKEEAEETRKAILRASLEIFCEKGYSRTTFDEIAKHINLTKGAIYWHFRNKADILTEIIRNGFSQTHENLRQKVDTAKGAAAIRDYMHFEARLIVEHQIYRQLLFFVLFQMEWSEAILNKVTKEVYEVIQYPLLMIKEALENAVKQNKISTDTDIDSAAALTLFIWQGIMRNIVKPVAPIPYDKLINDGYKLIINSLKDERSE